MKLNFLLRGVLLLAFVWGLVWGVSSWVADKKATPDRIEEMIIASEFEDWSQEVGDESRATTRRKSLGQICEVLNRLDYRQRQQLDEGEVAFDLFFKLSSDEKVYFLDQTFTKSAERLMAAFDKMDDKERERMMERAIRDMTGGRGAQALERLKAEDPEILNRIAVQGFKAYYQNATAETKMAIRPLMDAVGEVVQGFAKPGGGGL